MNVDSLAEHIIKRKDALQAERAVLFDKTYQDIVDLFLPNSEDFITDSKRGETKATRLFDTTGKTSAELLASILYGAMTSPSSKWFGLAFADDRMNESVANKEALKQAEDEVYSAINNPSAGFATAIHEVYINYVTLGTAGLFVGWSDKKDSVFFQSVYLKNLFIEENAEGSVAKIYRCFDLTLENIVEMFGKNTLTEQMRIDWENEKYDRKYKIIHASYENTNFMPFNLIAGKNFPYSSVYVLEDEKKVLKKGGYEEPAFFVARWSKIPGEVYGRSQAMALLPDVKMLQSMYVELLTGAQLANRPPLMVQDDAAMFPTVIKPNGLIRYDRNVPIPLNTGINTAAINAVLQDVRQRIAQGFFVDRLSLPDQTMTATEAWIRDDEKRRLLGPMVGRFETEMLSLMIQRVFGLLFRRGKIRPMQNVAQDLNAELRIDYISPLAQAQKRETASRLTAAVQAAIPFMQIDPSSVDAIDSTRGLKDVLKAYGAETILRTDADIDEIRGARQAAAEEQAQAGQSAQSMQLAGMANEVEKGVLENDAVREKGTG